MSLGIASWVGEVDAEVAASLYSLPGEHRVAGAVAARAADLWIHVDVILDVDAEGRVSNRGVSADELRAVLLAVPDARLDIHVITTLPAAACQGVLAELRAVLVAHPAQRWSAPSHLLDTLPADGERWQERWHGRRDAQPTGEPEGVLLMLIEPGTAGSADLAALEECRELRSLGVRMGVDGGVTEAVAQAAVAAGVGYLVSGRALFALDG